jgi:hypothetical protein
MGALYIIGALALAGIVEEVFAALSGNANVGNYDYHFATGVGAVFGTR